jgi:anti-sigma factor RsiW
LGWLRVGVAFAATMLFAALIWSVVPRNLSPSSDDLLARDIVDDHIRSLMVDHLTDIPSTDQHTVKPWFDGKLDYAPPVKDLSELGFKLIGGRLEYLAGKPVAALVYQHGNHFINLYVWPANRQPETEVAVTKKQGFNLFHWTSGGMTYWAASDLNDTELREFAQLIRT